MLKDLETTDLVPTSLFDTPIPGCPSNQIVPVSNNRNLGDFTINLSDLVANIVNRYHEELKSSYENYFHLSFLEKHSDIDLLWLIYHSHDNRYEAALIQPLQTRASKYHIFKDHRYEKKIGGSVPFVMNKPKTAITLFSLFGSLLIGLITFAVMLSRGTPWDLLLWVLPLLCSGIFALTLTKSIRHRNNDLKIISEARGLIKDKWLEFEAEMEKFKNQLDSDDVFLLKYLIKELGLQKELHRKEKDEIEAKLKQVVYRPREEVKREINAIKDQRDNIYKLKKELPLEEYEAKKESLRLLIHEKKNSLVEFEPIEQAITIELRKFNSILNSMDETMAALEKQRTSLMTKADLAHAINRSLGQGAIDWDHIRKSTYRRELTECLSKLQSLNESLLQINSVANNAVAQLPAAWQPKVLAATV